MYLLFLCVCTEPSCPLARAGSPPLALRQDTHARRLTQRRPAPKAVEELPGGATASAWDMLSAQENQNLLPGLTFFWSYPWPVDGSTSEQTLLQAPSCLRQPFLKRCVTPSIKLPRTCLLWLPLPRLHTWDTGRRVRRECLLELL